MGWTGLSLSFFSRTSPKHCRASSRAATSMSSKGKKKRQSTAAGGGKKGGKKGKNANLGQKLTSGATTAEDNSTLAGIDAAYGITLDDLRVKADALLKELREDLKDSRVLSFTDELEEELRLLYMPGTDSGQHEIDASEEMLQFSYQSQLNLQAFVDRISNFISRTPDVDQGNYYRHLLQLYESAYRSGLQRLSLTTKRAELIGAKERPHLHAILMDEAEFLRDNNARLFERFTSQRLVWLMQSGRWDQLPSRTVLQNQKVLTRSDFKEAHLGLLTAAVREGNYKKCLQLIDGEKGFVNETDGKSAAAPIHHAAWDGRLDIVELLVERKADIDRPTRRGYTALHFAYENHHTDLIAYLVEHGASDKIKSLLGQTPKDMEKIRDAKQLRRRKAKLQAAMDAAMAEQAAEAAAVKKEQAAAKKAAAKAARKNGK